MTLEIVAPPLIQRFADSKIQASVDKVLAGLPEGKTGAVIAIADLEGARLVTMARLSPSWSVVMVGERKWSGALAGEAAVVFTW